LKLFNSKHLEQVEESYAQHLKFGIWAGFFLIYLGTISLIHAIFPFLLARYPDRLYRMFNKKSSERITRVNKILKNKNLE
jgi:hypothetical protein